MALYDSWQTCRVPINSPIRNKPWSNLKIQLTTTHETKCQTASFDFPGKKKNCASTVRLIGFDRFPGQTKCTSERIVPPSGSRHIATISMQRGIFSFEEYEMLLRLPTVKLNYTSQE